MDVVAQGIATAFQFVTVGNIQVKDDLADWKRIESGIRAVLDGFIVR